eukprot:230323_1
MYHIITICLIISIVHSDFIQCNETKKGSIKCQQNLEFEFIAQTNYDQVMLDPCNSDPPVYLKVYANSSNNYSNFLASSTAHTCPNDNDSGDVTIPNIVKTGEKYVFIVTNFWPRQCGDYEISLFCQELGPTFEPTPAPTSDPTLPSTFPTPFPTPYPTPYPTPFPTPVPTSVAPTILTVEPTHAPTETPTDSPTFAPSLSSESPTFAPTTFIYTGPASIDYFEHEFDISRIPFLPFTQCGTPQETVRIDTTTF